LPRMAAIIPSGEMRIDSGFASKKHRGRARFRMGSKLAREENQYRK
jgi:hypothetical protein